MDQLTQTGLALDNAVGNIHLAAQGGEPHNKLDGVNIVSDDHQLGLLRLNELGDVIQTVLNVLGLGTSLHILRLRLLQ